MATCWNGEVPQKIQEITDSDLRYFEETYTHNSQENYQHVDLKQ